MDNRFRKECRNIPEGWENVFLEADESGQIERIAGALYNHSLKNRIFPPMKNLFTIMHILPPENIKIVLIGQDPYHRRGQAMGMSFSVPSDVSVPSSLSNMFKELVNEGYTQYSGRRNGDLTDWAEKGVFLYNAGLTVNEGKAGSHGKLWDPFSKMVIAEINRVNSREKVAWLLMGNSAKRYEPLIRCGKVFRCVHPSGLSAHKGFFGCGVFREIDEYLDNFSW